MKIVLISPSQKNVYGAGVNPPYPPLGLLGIAAILRERGHCVKFIDIDVQNISDTSLLDIISDFRVDLVCLTAVTPTYNAAIKIAKNIKQQFDVKIVLGGIHATIVREAALAAGIIDFLVVGEGEETIAELVDEMGKVDSDYTKINGLYSFSGDDIVWGGDRSLVRDLDSLPWPALDLIIDVTNYSPPNIQRSPVLPIMTSRGCPYSCSFCCSEKMFGHSYRTRSLDSIIAEIKYYIKKYAVKEIHILDDLFLVNKKRVIEFCQRIFDSNLDITFSFANGVRVDMIDDDILVNLKKIGFKDIGFGVESGNQTILDGVNKKLTIDQIKKGFKLCKKYKFETWCFFIIGLPGDTEKTVRETIDFAIELDPDYAKFLILKPFPGSKVYYDLKQKGCILSEDYDKYGVYSTPVHFLEDLSPSKMLYLQKIAFIKFYLRPKKIWRQLMKLNSLVALKSFYSMLRFFFNRLTQKL